jgi:hypothetical protein
VRHAGDEADAALVAGHREVLGHLAGGVCATDQALRVPVKVCSWFG